MARKGRKSSKSPKTVETLTHAEAKRKNIPSAEHQSVMREEDKSPIQVAYERRNKDLDPQLVWRGKDMQDWSDLVVQAMPLYIQEKVHPKVLIDDLRKLTTSHQPLSTVERQTDLFSDFNGIPEGVDKTEFYQHEANWSNRMILGDSLQVMASLAEREGLRGKAQCIYFDPPYGIKFNSNFQWSTTSRDVKDGKADHITREPEQVKAFRDTWRDGIHSYLTYLRDRLTVARDLLTESGSIFVQIGDENVHFLRGILDEVFLSDNFVSLITVRKTGAVSSPDARLNSLGTISDYVIWYAKRKETLKYRQLYTRKADTSTGDQYRLKDEGGTYQSVSIESNGYAESFHFPIKVFGRTFYPAKTRHWSTTEAGIYRVATADRVIATENKIRFKKYLEDFSVSPIANIWADVMGSSGLIYVVQTNERIVERCILMATDPGDLVLDPTCGSGTTAYVAEQWGRRWITIDTSRVALALARARIMGARYPYYLLADSKEGQEKEAEISGQWSVASGQKEKFESLRPTHGNIRHGFVYERVPHITLKAIANNAEIDVIWEQWQAKLEPLRKELNELLGTDWQEWEIPRELTTESTKDTKILKKLKDDPSLSSMCSLRLKEWWNARIARQKEIDASIAAKADSEYLYDKPYTDNKKVRVAGPFTVESLSPHRMLAVDEDDRLVDSGQWSVASEEGEDYGEPRDFGSMILENLRMAGVQQAHKEDRIVFTSLVPWPGNLVCAEGRFVASGQGSGASGQGSGVSGQGSGVSGQGSGVSGQGSGIRDQWSGSSGQGAVIRDQKPTTDHQPSTTELRAGILIGPEFGTVQRNDLVESARECGDAGFDVLIACAFNFDAHSSEFDKLGKIPVLKARMNADLHMAKDLKATGKGNLFVIFGEPDITVVSGQWLVTSNGRRIANYDLVKELSGLGSLEEINRLDRDGLSAVRSISAGRKVRADKSDQTRGNLRSGEHRGGRGTDGNEGVSSVSGDRLRLPGGDGDLSGAGGTTGHGNSGADSPRGGEGRGGWPDAQRTQALAALKDLNASDFPLTLTTDHWSQITVNGVDVFHPQTGEVRSDGPEGIACWFIDTDYNGESFFVRHAYFLGQNDPYKALKTTLKAEINEEAWATLHSATSRPFDKPDGGRIAVKVINHLGDEVMKVFRV